MEDYEREQVVPFTDAKYLDPMSYMRYSRNPKNRAHEPDEESRGQSRVYINIGALMRSRAELSTSDEAAQASAALLKRWKSDRQLATKCDLSNNNILDDLETNARNADRFRRPSAGPKKSAAAEDAVTPTSSSEGMKPEHFLRPIKSPYITETPPDSTVIRRTCGESLEGIFDAVHLGEVALEKLAFRIQVKDSGEDDNHKFQLASSHMID